MAEFKVELKGAKMSARKARLVVDLVRGKTVQNALDVLRVTNKKAAPLLIKMVESAVANAQQRATVDVDRLYIAEAFANEGPTLQRWLPRAQGRATPLRKRSSHLTVKLKEL